MNALKSLNPYFWKNRVLLSWGLLFIILSNFFSIYMVQFVGKSVNVIENVLTKKNIEKQELLNTLLIYGGIIIGASLLSGFFRFMMRQTIIVSSRNIEFDLKNKIYEHYQKLSVENFKETQTGDLLNRLSEDVTAIRMYLGPGVMYVVNLFILLVITSFYMFKTDIAMTFWSLLPLPILSFMIYAVSSTISKKSKIVQKSQAEISTFVQDAFSGIRIIKFFVKEKYSEKQYQNKVMDYQNKSLNLAKTEALFFPLILMVVGVSNVIILYIGGKQFMSGHANIGTIADFFMYLNILIWPFSLVGWVTSINQRAEAAMQRVNEFLHKQSEIVNNATESKYPFYGSIEFKNVSYTYKNTGIKALDNVSFKINAGQSIAIKGKTGSGKSTIALLLCRLLDPTEGEILIDGKNLKEHHLDYYRSKIGYIPQESYLFSDSIFNNIGFSIDKPNLKEITEFAKLCEVHDTIMGFKDQYETFVGERGVMLSGGQKQRLCMARALISKPELLIFDDSLSALDTETEDNILHNIETQLQKTTKVIITHRESSAKNTEVYLELLDGKVICLEYLIPAL